MAGVPTRYAKSSDRQVEIRHRGALACLSRTKSSRGVLSAHLFLQVPMKSVRCGARCLNLRVHCSTSPCVADLRREDNGNYSCEVRGSTSRVLANVTHSVVVRGKKRPMDCCNTSSLCSMCFLLPWQTSLKNFLHVERIKFTGRQEKYLSFSVYTSCQADLTEN